MRTRILAFVALLATPALAEDKAPEPCCTLHLTPDQVNVIVTALPAAPIPANQSMPVYQAVIGQAQTELKASADYEAAHAPKPEKK